MIGLLVIALGILALVALAIGAAAAQFGRYVFAMAFGLMGLILMIGSVSVFCQLGTEHTTPTCSYEEDCSE